MLQRKEGRQSGRGDIKLREGEKTEKEREKGERREILKKFLLLLLGEGQVDCDRVLLYNPGWPQITFVVQVGPEII